MVYLVIILKYIFAYLQNRGMNFRLDLNNITPITAKEYNLPATRPQNSVLDTQLIQKTFAIKIPTWQEQVKGMLNTIKINN